MFTLAPTAPSAVNDNEPAHVRPSRLRFIERTAFHRAMCALNIPAAGVPGALLIAAPSWAASNLLGLTALSAETVTLAIPMLGSIWLSIGVVSAAGLFRPEVRRSLAGLFALQAAYKTVWVTRTLLSASALSTTTIGFVAGYVAVIPLLAAVAVGIFRSSVAQGRISK